MLMLDKFLEKKKNVYLFALLAIVIESFSTVCLKNAGKYPVYWMRKIIC